MPPRGRWDEKGIDLLVWTDRGPFSCAVQCKGFEVQELGPKQIRQVEASVRAFLAADARCDQYLVVHNRDGRHADFNHKVKALLNDVLAAGKARRVDLWDRQKLLRKAFDRLATMLATALRAHSATLFTHYQELFRFGHIHVPAVPVIEERLLFKRLDACSRQPIEALQRRDISVDLLAQSDARWTLLTGPFGSGKTTAALHAAMSQPRAVILVACGRLSPSGLITSTNELLEQVVKVLDLFADYDDRDRSMLDELSGPVLGSLLRKEDSDYTLVLDGLDENRAYSNHEGLQRLSNQVADLSCPIVFTTREEHLNAMFGDFSAAFYEFSTKKGPRRHARLFTLLNWGKLEVRQFVHEVLAQVTGDEHQRLSDFVALLDSGEYARLYGELPFSPLFLQFILEDVAMYGVRSRNRAALIRSWVERKIRRDRQVPRVCLDSSLDIEEFVARMITLMEDVANLMTATLDGTCQLTESIPSTAVAQAAEAVFRFSSDPVLPVLLNSVLMAQSVRRGSAFDVTFAFRVFHEYFLASYLARENRSASEYPEPVQSLYSEIAALRDTRPVPTGPSSPP